jgi:hypothetical protein
MKINPNPDVDFCSIKKKKIALVSRVYEPETILNYYLESEPHRFNRLWHTTASLEPQELREDFVPTREVMWTHISTTQDDSPGHRYTVEPRWMIQPPLLFYILNGSATWYTAHLAHLSSTVLTTVLSDPLLLW